MKKISRILSILLTLLALAGLVMVSCTPEDIIETPDEEQEQGGDNDDDEPDDPDEPDNPDDDEIDPNADPYSYINTEKYGQDYLYDPLYLPEMHLSVTQSEWDDLLAAFDANNATTKQIHANLKFVKGSDVIRVNDIGLRLKGNVYSRKRPQSANSGRFKHVHYQLNLGKWVKDNDEAQSINGAQKICLKWFKDDPTYVREILVYNLFKDAGVWTASYNQYCQLYISVAGTAEKYLGIYDMIEHLDKQYLKSRKKLFGSSKGFLWKLRNGVTFNKTNDNIGADLDDGKEYTYELKTKTDSLGYAKTQLNDFISHYNKLEGEQFHEWVQEHMDVPLFLRTYAVIVAVGLWDDYWNDGNNSYCYFNSTDPTNYKFYFIPYDCDNTLGIGNSGCGTAGKYPASCDPYNWGPSWRPLVYKLLQYSDFKAIYTAELLRMVDPAEGIMDFDHATLKVKKLQSLINGKVANDTNEDTSMYDAPPSWSSADKTYYLLKNSSDNFFKAKAASFDKFCK